MDAFAPGAGGEALHPRALLMERQMGLIVASGSAVVETHVERASRISVRALDDPQEAWALPVRYGLSASGSRSSSMFVAPAFAGRRFCAAFLPAFRIIAEPGTCTCDGQLHQPALSYLQ
jgi:hypothetical protein